MQDIFVFERGVLRRLESDRGVPRKLRIMEFELPINLFI